jgi:hypothetical protein
MTFASMVSPFIAMPCHNLTIVIGVPIGFWRLPEAGKTEDGQQEQGTRIFFEKRH